MVDSLQVGSRAALLGFVVVVEAFVGFTADSLHGPVCLFLVVDIPLRSSSTTMLALSFTSTYLPLLLKFLAPPNFCSPTKWVLPSG